MRHTRQLHGRFAPLLVQPLVGKREIQSILNTIAHEGILPRGLCLFDITMDENRCDFRENRKNDHEDDHDDSIRNDAFHDFTDRVFFV